MINEEQRVRFNQVLMRLKHKPDSKRHLLKYPITQDTLDEMVDLEYLIEYEKDGDIYYEPTEKSKDIW